MAKTKKTDTDVLEPPVKAVLIPVPPEVTEEEIEKIVEKDIQASIVKYNVTDSFLAALNEKHKDLTITGQDDKKGYEAVHEARMEFVGTRVLITKMCKAGRETAVLTQKKWVAKEKKLIEIISPGEKRLEKLEVDFDAEKNRIKAERIEMQRNRLRDRMKVLLDMGAINDGVSVYLDDVSFEVTDIRESEEEDWLSDIVPEYKKVFDAKESIRIENERIQNDKQKELDRQKEEFENLQKQFRQQQEEFENQKKQAALQRRNRRIAQVEAIGMKPVHPSGDYVYVNTQIANHVFDTHEDADWDIILRDASNSVSFEKAEQEKETQRKENERLENARKQAALELLVKERHAEVRSLGYVSNEYAVFVYKDSTEWSQTSDTCVNAAFMHDATAEEWETRMGSLKNHAELEYQRVAQEQKEKILKEEKDRQEEQRLKQLEDSEKATDKVKWQSFLNQINAISLPNMKRQPYIANVEKAVSYIQKINNI